MCTRIPASDDVYCMGGFKESDGEFTILASVEHFDLSAETWEFKAPMVTPRADFALG